MYRTNFIGEELTSRLRALGVPVQWLGEKSGKRFDPAEDSVKVMTMHSSKGLEFPVVAIPGLGFMPPPERDLQDEARLLYVGMTRAMDQLIMTWHKENPFVSRLMEAQANQSRTKVWN